MLIGEPSTSVEVQRCPTKPFSAVLVTERQMEIRQMALSSDLFVWWTRSNFKVPRLTERGSSWHDYESEHASDAAGGIEAVQCESNARQTHTSSPRGATYMPASQGPP